MSAEELISQSDEGSSNDVYLSQSPSNAETPLCRRLLKELGTTEYAIVEAHKCAHILPERSYFTITITEEMARMKNGFASGFIIKVREAHYLYHEMCRYCLGEEFCRMLLSRGFCGS